MFAFNNMDFHNQNYHMKDNLGTVDNLAGIVGMVDMAGKMGMDAAVPMHFLLGLPISLQQTEHQRKRIVDLDEDFCFCNYTLKNTSFFVLLTTSYATRH